MFGLGQCKRRQHNALLQKTFTLLFFSSLVEVTSMSPNFSAQTCFRSSCSTAVCKAQDGTLFLQQWNGQGPDAEA